MSSRHIKIVDTVGDIGQAEKFLIFRAGFEQFFRNKYKKTELLKIDPLAIVKKYNLKGFTFGNYVTQEERYHFLFKIEKQLEFLSKVSKTNDLGKGILIIAFGSQGKPRALAHFNASKWLINLNRGRKGSYTDVLMGENSFLHEYGHFLDFYQGYNDKTIPTNAASELQSNATKGEPKTRPFAAVVNQVEENKPYMEGLEKSRISDYLTKRIEIFARLFESTLTYYVFDNMTSYAPYFDEKQYLGNSWYLSKAETKKGKYTAQLKGILQGKLIQRTKTVSPGTKKPKKAAKKTTKKALIPVKEIKLIWSEGFNDENKTYNSFEALRKDLKRAYKHWEEEQKKKGYVKNKIRIEWTDGKILEERFDIGNDKSGDYNPNKEPLSKWLNKYGYYKNNYEGKYQFDGAIQKKSNSKPKFYIEYLNKDKGFKKDIIKFNTYLEAENWAFRNLEKFDPDMIKPIWQKKAPAKRSNTRGQKNWLSNIPYKRRQEISETILKKSVPELEEFIKKHNKKLEYPNSSKTKQQIRQSIQDAQTVLKAKTGQQTLFARKP